MLTTSKPIVTSSLWEEVRTQLHNDVVSAAVLNYNIPDEIILNIDQTPSKLYQQKMLRWLRLNQSMFQEKAEMITWHYCYFVSNNHWKDIAFSIDLQRKNCTLISICRIPQWILLKV